VQVAGQHLADDAAAQGAEGLHDQDVTRLDQVEH
jgi:hypothetical protein